MYAASSRSPGACRKLCRPSSASHDQIRKRRVYERGGVAEFWILHPLDGVLTIYRRSNGDHFEPPEIVEASGIIELSSVPGLSVDFTGMYRRRTWIEGSLVFVQRAFIASCLGPEAGGDSHQARRTVAMLRPDRYQDHPMIRFTVVTVALLTCTPVLGQTLPPDLALTDICPACTAFDRPLIVRHAGDGSGRLFVVEQIGNIRVFSNGAYLPTPFLTFVGGGNAPPGGFVTVGGVGDERGLLGLAFHPNFAQNRYLFVNYSDASGDTVVARYQTSAGNPNVVDTATRTVILRVDQPFSNHNGGNILFGPDGYLYIGMGDGGSSNDPCNRAQSLTPADLVPNEGTSGCPAAAAFTSSGGNADSRALLGKMLRINVDATTAANGANELCGDNADGSANYAIPADNPFAGNLRVTGACDEVLDYGLRNPWRFSFDRQTGELFIGDVGQNAQEEVSYRPAGAIGAPFNFGWDCREGTGSTSGGTCRAGDTLTGPILAYGRTIGFAVTGGYRIRGPIPLLNGLYVYADYGSRNVWFAEQTGPGTFGPQPTNANRWGQAPSGVASFGEDEQGRIYIAAFDGRVYRFTSATEITPTIFQNGFE